MSFLAKLEIDGEEMNVLEFQCTLAQDTDKSGKPSSDPVGGKLRLVIESTKSVMLFDWMISTSQTKNGVLTFFRRDAISKMRELQFKDGYCIRYDELFISYNDMPMRTEILISSKEITMNGSVFSRNWPLKF
ncbi:type VI secretion system tube protein TssD [Flavobacterium sp. '19STA2R22 D10 B1']|uniref:type VI secretion system tube protein TssD n=1 Tax=Flavobacterium aerium TaxID=3037261 RepID=UPI00278BE67B|nr:type VI secretion system tube protein TssD [Flavobacterium sp. '19STA2R22 D10 B1']